MIRRLGPTGQTLLIALLTVLTISIGGAGWMSLSLRQEAILATEHTQRAHLADGIAEAMAEAILTGTPETGRQILTLTAHNPRLVSVEVHNALTDTAFASLHLPSRATGATELREHPVTKGGRTVGRIRLVYTDAVLQEALTTNRRQIIQVFGLLLLVNLLILVPLGLWRVSEPLRRLAHQADRLRTNQFDETVAWTGQDEISRTGQSLELARAATVRLRSQLKERTTEVKTLSTTDRLTGLATRRRIDAILESEIHRALRFRTRLSIILVDLVQLRDLNARYGRSVGDSVLTEAALRLSRTLRTGEFVGRWSDGAFLIVCPETETEDAVHRAQEIAQAVSGPVFPGAGRRRIHTGIVTHDGRESIDSLLARVEAEVQQTESIVPRRS